MRNKEQEAQWQAAEVKLINTIRPILALKRGTFDGATISFADFWSVELTKIILALPEIEVRDNTLPPKDPGSDATETEYLATERRFQQVLPK